MKAVAYLRLSKQAEDNNWGLDAQRTAIEKWAADSGATIASWHVDDGVSGDTPIEDRKGLDEALAACEGLKSEGGGYLVVARRDRIARNMFITVTVDAILKKSKCRVHSATNEPGNGDSATDELMKHILAAFASYERQLIRMRTKAALAEARANGKQIGAIGLEFRRPEVVVKIYEMRRAGLSYAGIAKQLNLSGVRPPRSDADCWHSATVYALCARLGFDVGDTLPPEGENWEAYFIRMKGFREESI